MKPIWRRVARRTEGMNAGWWKNKHVGGSVVAEAGVAPFRRQRMTAHMKPDLDALAEEATPSQEELGHISRPWLVELIERALAKLQAQHEAEHSAPIEAPSPVTTTKMMISVEQAEAERTAAVAEALEGAVTRLELYAKSYDAMGGEVFAASVVQDIRENMIPSIRSLKPRTDLVCVRRGKLLAWGTAMPVLETMLTKALCFGGAQRAKEIRDEISRALAAAGGKPSASS